MKTIKIAELAVKPRKDRDRLLEAFKMTIEQNEDLANKIMALERKAKRIEKKYNELKGLVNVTDSEA